MFNLVFETGSWQPTSSAETGSLRPERKVRPHGTNKTLFKQVSAAVFLFEALLKVMGGNLVRNFFNDLFHCDSFGEKFSVSFLCWLFGNKHLKTADQTDSGMAGRLYDTNVCFTVGKAP